VTGLFFKYKNAKKRGIVLFFFLGQAKKKFNIDLVRSSIRLSECPSVLLFFVIPALISAGMTKKIGSCIFEHKLLRIFVSLRIMLGILAPWQKSGKLARTLPTKNTPFHV
jgi:hypothetical protein